MGKFKKGETPKGAVPINEGIAKEYQARSVEARRKNKTLAETLRKELSEKAGNSGLTKMEWLIAKALENHSKGTLTLKDLTYLQKLLGEDTLNINTNGPQVIVVSQQAIEASKKWGK